MTVHFTWQSAVLKSSCKSTTKLVLLVVGTYMNQHGTGAWPSYNTIAEAASLNRATVIEHINLAVDAGWLTKSQRFNKDGEAESNIYAVACPADVVANDNQVVVLDDHPSRLGQPPVVVQDDPNTPVLTPHVTPHKNKAASGLPDWLPTESWDAFIEMRKSMRKPMTEKAKGLMLKKLMGFQQRGLDVASLLDASTMNSWLDVYEPKKQVQSGFGGFGNGGMNKQEALEANNRAIAERLAKKYEQVTYDAQ